MAWCKGVIGSRYQTLKIIREGKMKVKSREVGTMQGHTGKCNMSVSWWFSWHNGCLEIVWGKVDGGGDMFKISSRFLDKPRFRLVADSAVFSLRTGRIILDLRRFTNFRHTAFGIVSMKVLLWLYSWSVTYSTRTEKSEFIPKGMLVFCLISNIEYYPEA